MLSAMNDPRKLMVTTAVLVGVLLVAVAVVYFVTAEHSLPSFFPGHVSAGNTEANHHHTKHGIAALVVALACFAFAWFQTGPKANRASSPDTPGT
jgi:amino acid permease